ncbi:lipid A biosynthesis lauroyl acyltransferase [Aureimonas fodinaquatilis]|uniref:Lipid A biosynthesis lauroyl acyltransferase n=1 Tax=Aureimonas fodinaquatilis TaxID=2565783 RepID=A0A5B0DWP5_9HYPH|nr:lipid A biosynthesis lauroyl acyltransferase [Aureimonas fodinaquatilis]KAA0971174.1 lipid A biosynthesis lauroyl acyltransferase [Aureimonas fodinaquatilis]
MNLRITGLYLRLRRFRDWLIAQFLFGIIAILQCFPANAGLAFADWLARTLGPLTPRHRLALKNLQLAYPEQSPEWVRRTARANWGQMGRIAAEYVYLDQLFDYEPGQADGEGRIDVDGVQLFEELRDRKGPFIFFTGHIGCFELLPVCAATFDLEVTALFRQPNNRYIAERVAGARVVKGGHLVPSRAGAARTLAARLDEGRSIGMLVDQKFAKGVPGTFFGRACKTNPLLPKLARQFEAEIYPVRCIRLPNGRYRLHLQPRLELPRTDDGDVDIAASTQLMNDVVEGWVRETPEQWMWFHRRWQV